MVRSQAIAVNRRVSRKRFEHGAGGVRFGAGSSTCGSFRATNTINPNNRVSVGRMRYAAGSARWHSAANSQIESLYSARGSRRCVPIDVNSRARMEARVARQSPA